MTRTERQTLIRQGNFQKVEDIRQVLAKRTRSNIPPVVCGIFSSVIASSGRRVLFFPDQELLLICDNAPWHYLTTPKIQLQPLPAYSPELNPVERLNQELRRATANQVWDQLELKVDKVDQLLNDYFEHPDKVRQLTLLPWIQEQLHSTAIPEL